MAPSAPVALRTRQRLLCDHQDVERLPRRLLRELLPAATRVAVLVNPADPIRLETIVGEVKTAAGAIGLQFQVVNASTSREIDAAFATLAAAPPDALFVGPDPFFYSRRGYALC